MHRLQERARARAPDRVRSRAPTPPLHPTALFDNKARGPQPTDGPWRFAPPCRRGFAGLAPPPQAAPSEASLASLCSAARPALRCSALMTPPRARRFGAAQVRFETNNSASQRAAAPSSRPLMRVLSGDQTPRPAARARASRAPALQKAPSAPRRNRPPALARAAANDGWRVGGKC
ncbi:MAG: hypothetical protein J3K34DRAFT_399997 [Monoraphidium minutum]|nr:MAG: hypothetical protein J3K34DRAFT_399997 [Monoraphidium minutum]